MPVLASDRNPVTEIPAADSAEAAAHFAALLRFETDCWDVYCALSNQQDGFVLLDVRSPESYAKSHVAGAVNLPHAKITERTLERFDGAVMFVVYCDGPMCNGADRAALRLAQLGRPVKKMIGGIEGWKVEGFPLVEGEAIAT